MARPEKPKRNTPGKGTPTESDRKVLERAQGPVSGEAPDVAGVEGGEKITSVDLSLHGDGVTHWQDELPSRRNARRQRENKIPPESKE